MSQKYLWLSVVLFLLLPYYFLFLPYYFCFSSTIFCFSSTIFVFQNAIQKQKTYFSVNSKPSKNAQVLLLTFPNIPFDKQSETKAFFVCTKHRFKKSKYYFFTLSNLHNYYFVKIQCLTNFNLKENKLRLLVTKQH